MTNSSTCFLSPHSDDTVMSAFNILTSGYLPRPYYLLTVFNISDYYEKTKIEQYRFKDITQIRNGEDGRFAQLHDLTYFAFDLADCLRRTNEVAFDPSVALDPVLIETVYFKLKKFIGRNCITNLVVQKPSGSKQHIDHRIVWTVAQRMHMEDSTIALYYLDDIPYSVIGREDDLIARFFLDDDLLSKKHIAMEIYASQMCAYFHERVDVLTSMNEGYERLFKYHFL